VKTLNISDDEVKGRQGGIAQQIAIRLEDGFFRKLEYDITEAQRQLHAYDVSGEARHMVYVSPRFDDFMAYRKEAYFAQMDDYLAARSFEGLEIVIHNACTPVHMPICMRAAVVDDEPS
jgi:hypothetical protein